jgi:ribosomal protein L40E
LVTISDEGAKYVGAKKCRKCHFKQYMSWKKTKMAKTLDVLKPKVRAEAKARLNFDPQKDYTKDPDCLACHTTGFGMLGGYKIPEKGDSAAKAAAKENAGTTCEACHGPGGKYMTIHEDIADKERTYEVGELYHAGQYKVEADVCTTCHNLRNPTVGADFHFDYEKYKAEDTHKNYPLEYRAK